MFSDTFRRLLGIRSKPKARVVKCAHLCVVFCDRTRFRLDESQGRHATHVTCDRNIAAAAPYKCASARLSLPAAKARRVIVT